MSPTATAPTGPSVLRKEQMHAGEGASLIARAHALNHFIDMQATATAAATDGGAPSSAQPGNPSASLSPTSPSSSSPDRSVGCLCFGAAPGGAQQQQLYAGAGAGAAPPPRQGNLGGVGAARRAAAASGVARPYFPDNLSAQPDRHPWGPEMEWVILGCVNFLEEYGLDEPNLFAVSAVDDLVRNLRLPVGTALPPRTDPHVASGAIKARVRHAESALLSKACLRHYIESTGGEGDGGGGVGGGTVATREVRKEWEGCHLEKAMRMTAEESGGRRAFVLARFMRLLGRVSANVESSRMNAHCLAKCVAPSMLHWDPNSQFALLMLGKITAYVMAMIEEARVHDEALCEDIERLEGDGFGGDGRGAETKWGRQSKGRGMEGAD